MATILIVSRTKFVCWNINFESRSRTDNILHENLGHPKNVTAVKVDILLDRRCGLFIDIP